MTGRYSALAPTRARQKTTYPSKIALWTPQDDRDLMTVIQSATSLNWPEIAAKFPGKTVQQVSERWNKVLNPSLVKGSWTKEEDQEIINFVARCGTKNWTKLAARLPGRIGKQCRERWRNHLNPMNNNSAWTPEEDKQLLLLHERFGNQWVKISNCMPGRTDNSIKNRWNSTLKKTSAQNQSSPDKEQTRPTLTLTIPIESDMLWRLSDNLMPLSSPTIGAPLDLPTNEFSSELYSPSNSTQMELSPFSMMAIDGAFSL